MSTAGKRYKLTELGLSRLRAAIYRRDNFTCQLCSATVLDEDLLANLHTEYTGVGEVLVARVSKKSGNPVGPWILTLDHIVRLADGGHPNSPKNLRAACAPCNHHRKYDEKDLIEMPDIEWRKPNHSYHLAVVQNRLHDMDKGLRATFQAAVMQNAGFCCTSCGRSPDPEVLHALHESYDGSHPINVRISENGSFPKYTMLMLRRIPGSDGLDPSNYDAVCTLCCLGFAV
jgi:5-methylcytosine-specific restriction endonuclease McrA